MVGPKRDDPERQRALLEWGRKAVEKKVMEDAQELKRLGAKPEDIVRASRPGRRAQGGVIVGESHGGTCWVLRRPKGPLVEYLKEHCVRLKSKEASKSVRRIKNKSFAELIAKGKTYGDGDI